MKTVTRLNRTTVPWRQVVAGTLFSATVALPQAVVAGEGGTTHVIPGALATLADNPPADGPLTFVKPMYMH